MLQPKTYEGKQLDWTRSCANDLFVLIKKVIIIQVKCKSSKCSKVIFIMLRNLRELFRILIFISHNNIWKLECLIAQICIYLFIVVWLCWLRELWHSVEAAAERSDWARNHSMC